MIEPYHGSLWGFWLGVAVFIIAVAAFCQLVSALFPTSKKERK